MIGWFVAAEPGECDSCGARTKINDSIYYAGRDALAIGGSVVEQRLCVECAP